MGGEVSRADRRVPATVRAGRAPVQHLERVQGPPHAGAQPAALAARLAAAQRERRLALTCTQVDTSICFTHPKKANS